MNKSQTTSTKSIITKSDLKKRAIKEFALGTVVAGAAGAISYASYDAAASSATGGTYTIYTSAIARGVVYAIKGLFTLLFPNLVLKWSNKSTAKNAKSAAKAEATIEDEAEPVAPKNEKIEF